MKTPMELLADIRNALHTMTPLLMQRKSGAIIEQSSRVENLARALRESLSTFAWPDSAEYTGLIDDIRRTSRKNRTISAVFDSLLSSTFTRLAEKDRNITYGRDYRPDTPATPMLVYQKG